MITQLGEINATAVKLMGGCLLMNESGLHFFSERFAKFDSLLHFPAQNCTSLFMACNKTKLHFISYNLSLSVLASKYGENTLKRNREIHHRYYHLTGKHLHFTVNV